MPPPERSRCLKKFRGAAGWVIPTVRRLAAAALLIFSVPAAVYCQAPGFVHDESRGATHRLSPEPEAKRLMRQRLEHWRQLTPERQSQLRDKFEQWRKLSPEEKARIRRNYDRWENMPPAERGRLRARLDRWSRLAPQRKLEIRERFHRRFEHLPPEEKQRLRARLRNRRPERTAEPDAGLRGAPGGGRGSHELQQSIEGRTEEQPEAQ